MRNDGFDEGLVDIEIPKGMTLEVALKILKRKMKDMKRDMKNKDFFVKPSDSKRAKKKELDYKAKRNRRLSNEVR